MEPESAESSAADFLARSPGSRAEASTGRQSQPLENRQTLDLVANGALERIADDPGLVVPEWTLYTVRAEQVEFWQADKQRKHTHLLRASRRHMDPRTAVALSEASPCV